MLQLKDLLEIIADDYESEYERNGYFAAVGKGIFFSFVIDGKKNGSFVL